METVEVYIGRHVVLDGEKWEDLAMKVVFNGEKLAVFDTGGKGNGTTHTLYRTLDMIADGDEVTPDNQYVVLSEMRYTTKGEKGHNKSVWLHTAREADFLPGGLYVDLGKLAGLSRPLTLKEALRKRIDG